MNMIMMNMIMNNVNTKVKKTIMKQKKKIEKYIN